VGVVLILAGVLGLLLSLLVRGGPLNQRRLTRPARPGDSYGSRVEERKRAAAADVAAVGEDERLFSPDTPGVRNTILNQRPAAQARRAYCWLRNALCARVKGSVI
jgi:hypothetical protein